MTNKAKQPFQKILNLICKYWAVVLIILFFTVAIPIAVCVKDNFIISINDTLDSNLAYLRVTHLKFIGEIDKDSEPLILGGDISAQRLFVFKTSQIFDLHHLIYYLFDAYIAYVICFFLRILLSILGWFILLKTYWRDKSNEYLNISLFIGFVYGLLPVWPAMFGFTFLPIFAALILLAYRSGKMRYIVILLLTIKLSGAGLALFGCFMLGFVLIAIVIDTIVNRRINKGLILSFVAMLIYYAAGEYSTVLSVSGGETVRTLNTSAGYTRDFKRLWDIIFYYLTSSKYHTGTNQKLFLAPVCFFVFVMINLAHIDKRDIVDKKRLMEFDVLYLWYLFNGFAAGMSMDEYGRHVIFTLFPFLQGLSIERFVWFNPMVLLMCMAIILREIYERKLKASFFVCVIGLIIMVFTAKYDGSSVQYDYLYANIVHLLGYEDKSRYTWHEYTSEELFDTIKQDLDYKGERAIAFGFLPSMLTYNGIYTLDGYDSGCSKEYYDEFTKLIQPYLETGYLWTSYYLNDGIRLYAYTDDFNWEYRKDQRMIEETKLLIDSNQFKKMGGKYVFSVLKITNSDDLGLDLINVYSASDSAYKSMYVYSISED